MKDLWPLTVRSNVRDSEKENATESVEDKEQRLEELPTDPPKNDEITWQR